MTAEEVLAEAFANYDVSPIKPAHWHRASVALAALRAAGWEVVRRDER